VTVLGDKAATLAAGSRNGCFPPDAGILIRTPGREECLVNLSSNGRASSPRLREIMLLAFTSSFIFVSIVLLLRGFLPLVDNFGDNPGYISAANGIRHWDFRHADTKHFWGLPYAMAALSTALPISARTALLLICWTGNLATAVLAYYLWGGWIAGFFSVLNFAWLQFSLLGGAEPLFMTLLLGAFVCMRRQRWPWAALLASLATVVRPLGFFALLGIGLVLVWKRQFRTAGWAIAIGTGVGILYVLPFATHLGNAFVNVQGYQQADWQGGSPLAWPFHAILAGITAAVPWTNLVLSFLWMGFVFAAAVAACWFRDYRQWWRQSPVEVVFAVAYFIFLYTYNSPEWARTTFSRFAIPILPFVLLAVERWIPRDRRLLWGIAILSSILAASSALGVRNVYAVLLQALA
jgi:hypothetical protein